MTGLNYQPVNAERPRRGAARLTEDAGRLVVSADEEGHRLGSGREGFPLSSARLADTGKFREDLKEHVTINPEQAGSLTRAPLAADYRARFMTDEGCRDWGRLENVLRKEMAKVGPSGRREKRFPLGSFGVVQLILRKGLRDVATITFTRVGGVA